ncbi:unnamed protein product [Cylicocyclus nassatus]|uniref:Uncharacterized protein n=1 Tax=Cylicocyclus nassatus TaxID=53992 RepID=A0AA36DNC8_CYLNA|nr:unnamed protein product [Cylicocyclus nassatus]
MSFNSNTNAFYSPSDFPELPQDDLYIDQFFPSDWNETIPNQTHSQQNHIHEEELTSVVSETNRIIPHQSDYTQFFTTPPQTQPFSAQSTPQLFGNEQCHVQYYIQPSSTQNHPQQIYENQFHKRPSQPQPYPYVTDDQAQPQQQGQLQPLLHPQNYNTLPPGNVSYSTTRSEGPRTFPGAREAAPDLTYSCTSGRRHSRSSRSTSVCTAKKVSGDELLEDPALLSHSCIPTERTKDKADRLSYEPFIDAEKRTSVMAHYMETNGYERQDRRSALNRAVNRTVREVTMTNVPEALRTLAEGESFLQVQEPDLHIYMSQIIVKQAVENNLFALVGDRIHKLNPRSRRGTAVRMEGGQVYTIHGICAGDTAPLRNHEEQARGGLCIFNKLKVAIQEAAEGLNQTESELRIILDFELAAINAAGLSSRVLLCRAAHGT